MDVSFDRDGGAPFAGSIFRIEGEGYAMLNHTSLIKAAEEAYQATPDGAHGCSYDQLKQRAPA
jgi:hypothetical protein